MTKLRTLETEIEQLSREELAEFREWFYEFDNEVWDRQIEEDVRSGKLDTLAAKAIESHRRGESREI